MFIYGLEFHDLDPNSLLHISTFIIFYVAPLRGRPHFDLWLKVFNIKPKVVGGDHADCVVPRSASGRGSRGRRASSSTPLRCGKRNGSTSLSQGMPPGERLAYSGLDPLPDWLVDHHESGLGVRCSSKGVVEACHQHNGDRREAGRRGPDHTQLPTPPLPGEDQTNVGAGARGSGHRATPLWHNPCMIQYQASCSSLRRSGRSRGRTSAVRPLTPQRR